MWLALPDHSIKEMKNIITELRDLEMFGTSPTAWQVIGEDISNFEEVCLQICEMIRKRDPRIGRTPKTKLKKKAVHKKTLKTIVKVKSKGKPKLKSKK